MAGKKLSNEEVLAKMETAKNVVPQENENKIKLSNNRVLEIKPTKIKYFKNGDYNVYRIIKKIGVAPILQYSDGLELIYIFMSAVFDKPYKKQEEKDEDGNYKNSYEFDEYILEMVDDELTIAEVNKIIEVSLKVNGIEENFQKPLSEKE